MSWCFFLFCVDLWFYNEAFHAESYLAYCSHFSVPFSIVVTSLGVITSLGKRELVYIIWFSYVYLACVILNEPPHDKINKMTLLSLISVFAGRTCHFVGFVMRRLIFVFSSWCPGLAVVCDCGTLSTYYYNWAASRQNQQNCMWAQRRLRSAWASAQSDQSLHCALNR